MIPVIKRASTFAWLANFLAALAFALPAVYASASESSVDRVSNLDKDKPRRRKAEKNKPARNKAKRQANGKRADRPGRSPRADRPDRPRKRVSPDRDKRQQKEVRRLRKEHRRYKNWERRDYRNHHKQVRRAHKRAMQQRRNWNSSQRRIWDNRWERRHVVKRSWRQSWRNYNRRIVRNIRWDIRNERYWAHRYNRYIERRYYLRPILPVFPVYPIQTPVPYPENPSWSYEDVLSMAYNSEYVAHELYKHSEENYSGDTAFERELLSKLYDVVEASQIYADRAHEDHGNFEESIYELFHLEKIIQEAKSLVDEVGSDDFLQSNFGLLEYYVQDLVWQYRSHWD